MADPQATSTPRRKHVDLFAGPQLKRRQLKSALWFVHLGVKFKTFPPTAFFDAEQGHKMLPVTQQLFRPQAA